MSLPTTIDRLEQLPGIPAQIVRQLNRIDEARGREALYRVQRKGYLESLMQVARIQSAEASNAIEGIVAPSSRIRALMIDGTKPRNRSEAEIAGYRSALDLIHANTNEAPFSTNVVLQLHQTMMQFAGVPGGSFKATDNVLEEELPDGARRVRFTPTPAWQTADAMRQLHADYHRAIARGEQPPVLLLAAYVLDFTAIHPFSDGNGRMSRLMTLLGLYHQNYAVGRYVSIEKIVEERKDGYYESLGASSQGWGEGQHDPLPWMSYFVGVLVAAYDRFEANVASVSEHKGAKSEAVENFVRSRAIPMFSIGDVREAVPTVSDATIRATLYKLRDEGVVEAAGRGRSAKWKRLAAE